MIAICRLILMTVTLWLLAATAARPQMPSTWGAQIAAARPAREWVSKAPITRPRRRATQSPERSRRPLRDSIIASLIICARKSAGIR